MFLRNINILFTYKQKFFFYTIIFGGILSTFFEMIGIGMIPIFAMIIVDPNNFIIKFTKLLNFFSFSYLSSYDQLDLILIFSIFLIILFLIKNLYLVFLLYLQGKFLKDSRMTVSNTLFNKYLNSDYIFHLKQSPSVSMRSILSDVSSTFICVQSYIMLIRESLIICGLFLILLIASPLISIVSLITLVLPLRIFYSSYKNNMKFKGKKLQESQTLIIKLVNQALGGIKETIIYKKEDYFYKEYQNHNKILEELIFYKFFITSIPRFFLEFVAICTIVLIACILFIFGKTEDTIPLISLISVSSIRLIPSLNTITSSFSSIRFLRPSMEFVIKEISSIHDNKKLFVEKYNSFTNDSLTKFHQGIILKSISFDYGEGRNKPVNNISLEISLSQSIGIIGKSGSGKSTLVDIIIGLLKPTSGELLIDGINIDHKSLISGWQKQIGYIPQDIYLLDDTIERNIAFGITQSEIDKNKIKNAIIYSQLDTFVQSLPLKENTIIGNRGVKLSGGQRQRLGIARALYNEPKVIILDEATSSLDVENEMKIIREVFNLKDKKTIIIVTHRYQTVKNCDNIFLLSQGRLLDSGNFNYLNKKYNLENNF